MLGSQATSIESAKFDKQRLCTQLFIYFMKLIPVLQKQQKLYQLAGFVVLLGAPCLIPTWKRDVVMNNLITKRNINWNIHLNEKSLVFWKSGHLREVVQVSSMFARAAKPNAVYLFCCFI